ncbi:DUF6438 domain-containing protein [Sphingomonas sp. PL-96]|uniref:DUF6438 domain-containing protein n=1 Tax=Sphingomonas sp. PL-96 TaxID=2887201 RepID=UPI001E5727C7|nr:DUF6438 domain-containing protein [Sphingomonas sp. PL-96]MCC2975118.1 DUF6438 domain-containing protein [Sphingomonas sp. PL-96]
MIRATMMAGAALALAACTPNGGGTASAGSEAAAAAGETIRFATDRCFGTCPVYSVTVRPDGTGTFEGEQFTAVTGARDFTLTPAQYSAFADRLAAFRPEERERRVEPGSPLCPDHATDMSSVDVTWSGGAGGTRHLHQYLGCVGEDDRDTRTALRTAPELLPIAAFLGERPAGR